MTTLNPRDEFARTLRYFRRHTPREDARMFNCACILRAVKTLRPSLSRGELLPYLCWLDGQRAARTPRATRY